MTPGIKTGPSGHRKRLREKFLSSGLTGFHDYEIVELLLTLGTPRKDCKPAAKAAMKRFKTFQGVLNASPDALCEVPGIGPANSFGIFLIKAVADRYLQQKLIQRDSIHHSKALFEYLYHGFRERKRECFIGVFLDAKNRVIDTEILFVGTLTSSSVYPREVIAAALRHHAAAIIFAHNHPSGEPEPSQEDRMITRQLLYACRVVGVSVHEHIIIGDNRYFSFADTGDIRKLNLEFERMFGGAE